MKVNYIVRVTVFCIDGSFTTDRVCFGANSAKAWAYYKQERARKLRICDTRRVVRLHMVEA